MNELQTDVSNTVPSPRVQSLVASMKASSLLSDLPDSVLADLAVTAERRKVRRGDIVMGPADRGLVILLDGGITVSIAGKTTRTKLFCLSAGDIIGEDSIFNFRHTPWEILATRKSEFLYLSREKVLRRLTASPLLNRALLGLLSERLDRVTQITHDLATLNVPDKLISCLARLASESRYTSPTGITIDRITQQDLASMVGSCRETVSRIMKRFQEDGLILRTSKEFIITRKLLDRAENL